MSVLINDKNRRDMLNRLKRAEGQLRGIQRMIEEGQPCLDIAGQMSAVRRALDSSYIRMTVCFLEQELDAKLGDSPATKKKVAGVMNEVQTLLSKAR